MKKIAKLFVTLLALALLVAAVAGCGDSGSTTANDTNEVATDGADDGDTDADTDTSPASDKTYLIATDTTFAPFEFVDENGDYVGVDIEILAAIAEDQGFTYDLQPLGFSAAVTALETGQADAVIAGMSITEERQQNYDFSTPYYDSGVVMAIAAGNDEINGYEDLAGKQVAVKTGTEGADFAESIKDQYDFSVVYFDESPFMYEEVKTGNSVACFEDYPVMGYGISQGNGLKMVTDMEHGSSYGFAVLKGKNPELIEMFNQGLENIRENGTYQAILDKYIATV